MKITIVFIITLFSCTNMAPPEEFEGVITYSEKLIAKRADLIDEKQLNKTRGTVTKLYYKNGNYRIESNGVPSKVTIFRSGDSLTYSFSKGLDTLQTNSVLYEKRRLDTLYFTGKTESIINRKCNEILMKIGKTKHTFWVDSSLYINPNNYSKYKFGFYDKLYDLSNSAYLKRTYESWVFRIEKIATHIQKTRLDDSLFDIPDFPTAKIDLKKK